jgi:hypothetical protein
MIITMVAAYVCRRGWRILEHLVSQSEMLIAFHTLPLTYDKNTMNTGRDWKAKNLEEIGEEPAARGATNYC